MPVIICSHSKQNCSYQQSFIKYCPNHLITLMTFLFAWIISYHTTVMIYSSTLTRIIWFVASMQCQTLQIRQLQHITETRARTHTHSNTHKHTHAHALWHKPQAVHLLEGKRQPNKPIYVQPDWARHASQKVYSLYSKQEMREFM